MAAFPSTLACVTTKGFSETLPYKKNYLGGRTFTKNGIANITVLIKTDSDMDTFNQWYLTNGNDYFTINLPLYGNTKDWTVRIQNVLKTSVDKKNKQLREIPLVLEVLDADTSGGWIDESHIKWIDENSNEWTNY